MLRQALVVTSLLLMVGCSATSSSMTGNQGGMHPGFGGASGYSGYGNSGAMAMTASAMNNAEHPGSAMLPGFGGASGYSGYGNSGAKGMTGAGAEPAHGMTGSEGGMRPGFGGASGYSGYGTPGSGGMHAPHASMGMMKDKPASCDAAGQCADHASK